MNRTIALRLTAALLLGGAVLGVAGCSAPAAAPTPTSSASATPTAPPTQLSIQNICLRAANLIKVDRKPQAALDLIDATRAPAIQALEGREPLTDAMTELLEACGAERRAALAAIQAGVKPAADPAPWSQQVQEWWEAALKDWITPLTGPAVVAGALAVLLVISARLFALAPGIRDQRTSVSDQGKLWKWGLALIVGGSVGIVVAISSLGDDLGIVGAITIAVASAIFAGAGVHWLALYLATRLRLDLEVILRSGEDKTAAKDDWATASVVALLITMGGRSHARGLEVADAADIKALTDATLPDTPASKVVDVIKRALAFVFTGTPWHIVVRTDPDGELATVSISRNGASETQVNIDVTRFGLPEKFDSALAIRVFAAAVVIMTLSQKHDGFEGLYGTTRWQSLGLTHLALRELRKEPAEAQAMLVAAFSIDPGNHTARVGLESSLYADADDAQTFADYARWLEDEADRLADLAATTPGLPRALEARVRATMLVMTLNARAKDPNWSVGLGPSAALNNADVLAALLTSDHIPEPRELEEWQQNAALSLASLPYKPQSFAKAERVRLASARLRREPFNLRKVARLGQAARELASSLATQTVVANTAQLPEPWNRWYVDALESDSPYTAYNAACHLRVAGQPMPEVLDRLRIAVRDPHFKEAAATDPELETLSDDPGFRKLTSTAARTDFWELDAFSAFKEKLTAVGYAEPADLARLAPGPHTEDLAVYLAVQAPQIAHLKRLSTLIAAVVAARPEKLGIESVDVEILSVMTENGVQVPDDLEDWVADGVGEGSRLAKLIEGINKKFNENLLASDLGPWLGKVRNPD